MNNVLAEEAFKVHDGTNDKNNVVVYEIFSIFSFQNEEEKNNKQIIHLISLRTYVCVRVCCIKSEIKRQKKS
jgi:hypothetical protein